MTTNGGPAFPVPDAYDGQGGGSQGYGGMTLRDWFAGQALSGMLCNGFMPKRPSEIAWDYPAKAYELADLMLAERAKP